MNDAYQGYYWLVTQAERHLGICPEKIVLCGDSAGGHLAIAVTQLAILRNFRVPDSLVLHYPTANSNTGHFFPSTLLTLDDFLLNYNLLFYVGTAFTRKGGDPSSNFILSPIYTPREVLSKFPPTKILVAEVDPLRD
jgi:acetyl esterase